MSTSQKVVVGALVLVVGLFVAAVVLGGGAGRGDASAPPGGLTRFLGDRLGGGADVEPGDLEADCGIVQQRLRFEGDCVITVAPSREQLRIVRLEPLQAVTITATAPGAEDIEVEKDIDARTEVAIAVDADGGDIELECAGPCVVRLKGA